jgi:hypothetical protein
MSVAVVVVVVVMVVAVVIRAVVVVIVLLAAVLVECWSCQRHERKVRITNERGGRKRK